MELAFVAIIGVGLLLVALLAIYLFNKDKKEKVEPLKHAYDNALQSGDKKTALEAGRNYYRALRNGKLSIYDEQAISNDLNTMKIYLLLLIFLPLFSFGQNKNIVISQFKSVISRVETRLKQLPTVVSYQGSSFSVTQMIYYKLQVEEIDLKYDIQSTNSIITPYTGYILLRLRTKTNARTGDVKQNGVAIGFPDSASAKLSNHFECCLTGSDDISECCLRNIRINYAYQNNKWIFKDIAEAQEVDVQTGCFNKFFDK